jgi:hypothetical protein
MVSPNLWTGPTSGRGNVPGRRAGELPNLDHIALASVQSAATTRRPTRGQSDVAARSDPCGSQFFPADRAVQELQRHSAILGGLRSATWAARDSSRCYARAASNSWGRNASTSAWSNSITPDANRAAGLRRPIATNLSMAFLETPSVLAFRVGLSTAIRRPFSLDGNSWLRGDHVRLESGEPHSMGGE